MNFFGAKQRFNNAQSALSRVKMKLLREVNKNPLVFSRELTVVEENAIASDLQSYKDKFFKKHTKENREHNKVYGFYIDKLQNNTYDLKEVSLRKMRRQLLELLVAVDHLKNDPNFTEAISEKQFLNYMSDYILLYYGMLDLLIEHKHMVNNLFITWGLSGIVTLTPFLVIPFIFLMFPPSIILGIVGAGAILALWGIFCTLGSITITDSLIAGSTLKNVLGEESSMKINGKTNKIYIVQPGKGGFSRITDYLFALLNSKVMEAFNKIEKDSSNQNICQNLIKIMENSYQRLDLKT